MSRLLPFVFLLLIASLSGLSGMVVRIDPESALWYIFGLFVLLIFTAFFSLLGLMFYFLRINFYRRNRSSWYFYISLKMAFFIALFITLVTTLAIFQQVTTLNIILAILAVTLFAIYSYLGERVKEKE